MLSIREVDVTISKRVDLQKVKFGGNLWSTVFVMLEYLGLETLSFSFPDPYAFDYPSDCYGYHPSSDDDSDDGNAYHHAGHQSEDENEDDTKIPSKLKASILRIVEENSATLKNLLYVPVGLLPLATGLDLRKLKLSYMSRSETGAELVHKSAKHNVQVKFQEIPRSDNLEFTSNNVLFPKFLASAVVSEVIHRAGSVDANRDLDIARFIPFYRKLQPKHQCSESRA